MQDFTESLLVRYTVSTLRLAVADRLCYYQPPTAGELSVLMYRAEVPFALLYDFVCYIHTHQQATCAMTSVRTVCAERNWLKGKFEPREDRRARN